jgi:hypothetical protein
MADVRSTRKGHLQIYLQRHLRGLRRRREKSRTAPALSADRIASQRADMLWVFIAGTVSVLASALWL